MLSLWKTTRIMFLLATATGLLAQGGEGSKTEAERNFFARSFSGTRTDFAGNVGYEFTAEATLSVTALGRSVSNGKLRGAHTVALCSVSRRAARGVHRRRDAR